MTPDELQRRVQDVKSAGDCFEQMEKALELRDDLNFSVMTEDELEPFHWLEPHLKEGILRSLLTEEEFATHCWLVEVIDRTGKECIAALED